MKTFTAYRPLINSAVKTHNEFQANDPDKAQYQGIIFDDGTCVIRWLTARGSTSCWNSFNDMLDIHGHAEYGTYLVYEDGSKQKYIGNGIFEDVK